jgi:hypothetical protein
VAPMAHWVFAAPAIAFALLPSVVGAQHAAEGIAVTAAITSLTAVSGVLIQPLARRLEAHAASNRAGIVGLGVVGAGLALAAVTAQAQQVWLLVPCAILLGCAYGLCLVAGLVEVGRLAGDDDLAGLTAAYYALTYLGFAAPYLLALGRPCGQLPRAAVDRCRARPQHGARGRPPLSSPPRGAHLEGAPARATNPPAQTR